ncbi:unnamed protein product, partial [Rotaria sordida]
MKKTFEYDDKPPSLPLPTLEHTLERYLDSVRAVVNDDEYVRTKKIVEQFAKGIGRELHEQLKANIEKHQERNWLTKWWDEEIYLKWRLPIAPTINMMGFSCLLPPKVDSQLTRACIHIYACALVFETIYEERYPISYMEREKGGYLIPLNNVNDRIKFILGISMSSVEKLKREMREQEREMLEKQNELIQLQKKLDQEKQDKEDAAIRATFRLRNPRTRSSSSSSVTAAFNSTLTTFMPVAKSSQKRGHSDRPPIILTENQKENVR